MTERSQGSRPGLARGARTPSAIRIHHPPYRIHALPGLGVQELVGILEEHRRILVEGGPELVQARKWRPVTRVGAAGVEYAVKQYGRGSVGSRIRRMLRGTKARRGWIAQRRLASRGLPVATAAAWIDVDGFTGGAEGFLISRWVPGVYLSDCLSGLAEGSDPRARWRLIEAAGRFVAAVHRQGIWLNDFWDRNVLVLAEPGRAPVFTLVDCDSAHFGGLTGALQLRNVRQFSRALGRGASRTDRLRFARAYLHGLGFQSLQHHELQRHLLALLDVESHEGILPRLAARTWRRMEPIVGSPVLAVGHGRGDLV